MKSLFRHYATVRNNVSCSREVQDLDSHWAVDSAEPDSDAHIYLCLYGERGDTGKRVISFMESDHKEKFQEGQVIFKKSKYFRQQ